MDNVIVELEDICVDFDGQRVVNKLNLTIHDNEFVTLLGPSGCGKTTTLRVIGGFVSPDEGDVFFEGKRINDVPLKGFLGVGNLPRISLPFRGVIGILRLIHRDLGAGHLPVEVIVFLIRVEMCRRDSLCSCPVQCPECPCSAIF